MAIDFSQERRWKMATHQSIAALCVESISLITAKQRKVFEQVLQPLKDICSKISATVRNYWETYNIYQNKCDGKLLAEGSTSQEASRFFFEAVDEVLPSIIDNLRVKKLFYVMENTILTSKQMECTNRIAHINSIGYGAILFGLPHSGKSMVLAYLVKEWIVGARRSFLNSAPSLQPCVVVFSPWYVLALWQYKLQLVGVSAAIWNATMKTTLVSNVLLVCNRDAITFMETFGQYVDCKIVGVVLDTRESVVELVKCNKDRIIKGSACRPSEENNDWIPVVFEIIGASVSRRCVVVDDLESCPVDKSHLLAALVPAYFAYKHLYPPARRCLDLMERLKVQCDLDHQASLKVVPILHLLHHLM